jgi:hypothetical protein
VLQRLTQQQQSTLWVVMVGSQSSGEQDIIIKQSIPTATCTWDCLNTAICLPSADALPKYGYEVTIPPDFAEAYGMNGKITYLLKTSYAPTW